ncbi:tetratricopeptide repeat protein [Candidatus Roizmanbacteria bacterium]|jgi:tetratricopeptide (TPR) repeat protein|nr:tetratricopeptide repeat protein [Candidatus Roizmanbacteria bacterium]
MENVEVLEQYAIDAALNLDWKKAIEFNQKILIHNKKNVSALLRLGFAYFQNGDLDQAKKSYLKTLKLQPNNTTVKEQLERIKILQEKGAKKNNNINISFDPGLFLEVPGKTKSVVLVNIGQKNILAQLTVGEEVYLKPKKRRVEIRTKNNEYIGRIPDDLSKRLLLFLKAKSRYSVFVKEAGLNQIVIFIREESKGKKISRHISFPLNPLGGTKTEFDGDKNEEEEDLTDEDLLQLDVEKMAANIGNEDKEEYLPYDDDEEDAEE